MLASANGWHQKDPEPKTDFYVVALQRISEGPRAQKLLLRFSAFQKDPEPNNGFLCCCASAHFRRAEAQQRISVLLRFSAFQKSSEPKTDFYVVALQRISEGHRAQQRISMLLRFSAFQKGTEPNNGGLKIYRLIWFGKSGTKRANLATLYFRKRLAISSFFQ